VPAGAQIRQLGKLASDRALAVSLDLTGDLARASALASGRTVVPDAGLDDVAGSEKQVVRVAPGGWPS
jgi:hypothetical protein